MKIALIGSAPSSVRIAPYGAPDWRIWACSPGAYGVAQNVEAWFELHRWEPGQPWFSEGYVDFLKNFPGKVWMSEKVNAVKNCHVIPVNALVDTYGPYFFTSSLSWMFAMAIEEILQWRKETGQTGGSIGLWGVDMAATEEYGYQRAGCQFFAMLAKSHGIEVGVPPESDLLRPAPLYGVCETSHAWIKTMARRRELEQRLFECQHILEQKQMEVHFVKGALDDLNYMQENWLGNVDSLGKTYIEPTTLPELKSIDLPKVIGEFGEEGDLLGIQSHIVKDKKEVKVAK